MWSCPIKWISYLCQIDEQRKWYKFLPVCMMRKWYAGQWPWCWWKEIWKIVSIFSIPTSIRLGVALAQIRVAFCEHWDETLVAVFKPHHSTGMVIYNFRSCFSRPQVTQNQTAQISQGVKWKEEVYEEQTTSIFIFMTDVVGGVEGVVVYRDICSALERRAMSL